MSFNLKKNQLPSSISYRAMMRRKYPLVKGGANQVHLVNSTYSIYIKFEGSISMYTISLNTNFYLVHLNIISFTEININHWKSIKN